MILIDFSQIIHNNLYSMKEDMINDGIENTINFLKHHILTKILYISKTFKQHKEIVLCADSRDNWRNSFYPNYKGRRKLRRKNDDFPWDEFWKHMDIFEQELNEMFPFNYIKVDRAEGDDIIGTLVYYIMNTKPNEEIIIVSSDKDFKQLQLNQNIKQYDPRENKEIKTLNPQNELMWLILAGDDDDDVLNVKTTDIDTFINPDKKQIRMWYETKVWEHINNNTVMDELLVDIVDKKTKEVIVSREQLLKNFERNRKLVDLSKCPIDIQKEIVYQYESNRENIPERNRLDLLKYFIKNKMIVLSNRVDEFDSLYKFDTKTKSELMGFLDD